MKDMQKIKQINPGNSLDKPKRKKATGGTSPTQRSLAHLRSQGYVCQVVEKYNFFAHIRQDLFGLIDIVCIKEGENGVLGIQTTSDTNRSEHRIKIYSNSILPLWLKTGNKLILHTWGKHGSKGKRKLWELFEEVISL